MGSLAGIPEITGPLSVRRVRHTWAAKVGALLHADRTVWLVLLNRCMPFVTTPVTLLIVATRFSPVYQGYYYTFTSVTSLALILELGLGLVLVLFTSHEFAHLAWGDARTLTGEPDALARVFGVLTKATAWYAAMALVVIVIGVPAGLRFFGAHARAAGIPYAGPWVALVVCTGLSMVFVPTQAIIEGGGRLLDVQRMRLWQSLAASTLLWVGVLASRSLYAVALSASATVVVPALWQLSRFRGLTRQVFAAWRTHGRASVSWREELLPMQWRIAVSWLAGALVAYLFNPLLFRYQGPVVAGQMGMSLTLANAPAVLGMSWLSVSMPGYGTLIRRRQYADLDASAARATRRAAAVAGLGYAALIVVVAIGRHVVPKLGQRVLPLPALVALCVASLGTVLMSSMAFYLRAHKQEPYMGVSIGTGLLVAAMCWVTARYGTPLSMSVGYAVVVFAFQLPVSALIFVRKRREWHAEPEAAPVAAAPAGEPSSA